MAELTNFTVERDNQTHETNTLLHCSVKITGEVHDQLIFIPVVNGFLSIIALLGNTLILVALRKELASLQTTSKLLYRNLAITDLCVGVIAQPLCVAYWSSVLNETWNTCYYAIAAVSITASILGLASLLTLTTISVDRLLALLLGLKYQEVVTKKKAVTTVAVIWVLSVICPVSNLYLFIMACLCLVTLIFSYTKIFLTLRHYKIQVPSQASREPTQAIPLNIARYRKGVYSALWVQVALIICYLPHFVAEIYIGQKGMNSSVYYAAQLTVTFVFLNSSLNPILYCWKIGEVREAVKNTLRQRFCASS